MKLGLWFRIDCHMTEEPYINEKQEVNHYGWYSSYDYATRLTLCTSMGPVLGRTGSIGSRL
jgi:hypothetical protein